MNNLKHTKKTMTNFELDKIRRLKNRLLALEELNEINLAKTNLEFRSQIIEERKITNERIEKFWQYICDKYNLSPQKNYMVSAETKEILFS